MHRIVIAALALVAAVATVATAATTAGPAAAEPRAAARSLDFQAVLHLSPSSVPCPADVPPSTTECQALSLWDAAFVRGLGWVSEEFGVTTYTLPLAMGPPTCPAGLGKALATSGRLAVPWKGEIRFTLAEGARCVRVPFFLGVFEPDDTLEFEPIVQEFTITGGTGAFAGASGRGEVERGLLDPEYQLVRDVLETWTGTLTAPGLHVDPPRLTGAVAKTVRAAKGAKSARVTFEVTAADDGGGAVPVSCYPRSGSRFPLGKTTVTCAATDSNGNTATAKFTVTVKRGR